MLGGSLSASGSRPPLRPLATLPRMTTISAAGTMTSAPPITVVLMNSIACFMAVHPRLRSTTIAAQVTGGGHCPLGQRRERLDRNLEMALQVIGDEGAEALVAERRAGIMLH